MSAFLVRLKAPAPDVSVWISAAKVEVSDDGVWFIFVGANGSELGRYRQEAVLFWHLYEGDRAGFVP